MKIIADLHVHSGFSRATSKDMNAATMAMWANKKGINLLGTGDFTHPVHFKNLQKTLKPAGNGLYTTPSEPSVFFMSTAEISSIYSQGGKVRRIHNIIMAPGLEVAEKINNTLGKRGNLSSDGRPILGTPAKDLLKIVMDISEDCLFVPAHAWTPWFSVFGSKSGFDSIEECFGEYAKYIYAIETGLSSDPEMNWRLSALDKITLLYTVEFFPEEGKYHYDGHRLCNVLFSPDETKKHKTICPVCKKPLTVGVMNRVYELADRPEGFVPPNALPCVHMAPLVEIISEAQVAGVNTVGVKREYEKLTGLYPELTILMDLPDAELFKIAGRRTAEGIIKVRAGDINIVPGYDGVYGEISIFSQKSAAAKKSDEKPSAVIRQQNLF
ncbi:MAG: DNA helicase UvrD [Nitrospirae bacterium]|nr:DNA helicase UvrD [Nitrospirota bacterium]